MAKAKQNGTYTADDLKKISQLRSYFEQNLKKSTNEAEKKQIRRILALFKDGVDVDIPKLHDLLSELQQSTHKTPQELVEAIDKQQSTFLEANKVNLQALLKEAKHDFDKGEADLYEVIYLAKLLKIYDPQNKEANKFLDKANIIKKFEALQKTQNSEIDYAQLPGLVIAAQQIREVCPDYKPAKEWTSEAKLKKVFEKLWQEGEFEGAYIVLKVAEDLKNTKLAEKWLPLTEVTAEYQQSMAENAGNCQALAEYIAAAYPGQQELSKELLITAIKNDSERILAAELPDFSLVADLQYDVLQRTKFADKEALQEYLECKIASYLADAYPIKGTFFSWQQDTLSNAKELAHLIILEQQDLPSNAQEIKPFMAQLIRLLAKEKIDLYYPEQTAALLPKINKNLANWREEKVPSSFILESLLEIHPRSDFGSYESDREEKHQAEGIKSYLAVKISDYLQNNFPIKPGYFVGNLDEKAKFNANQLALAILEKRHDLPKTEAEVKEFLASVLDKIAENKGKIDLYYIDKTLKLVPEINSEYNNWHGYKPKIVTEREVSNLLDGSKAPVAKPDLKLVHAARRRQQIGAALTGGVTGLAAGGAYSLVAGGGIGAVLSSVAGAGSSWLAYDLLVAQDELLSQKSGIGKLLTKAGIAGTESFRALTEKFSKLSPTEMGMIAGATTVSALTGIAPVYLSSLILCKLLPEPIRKAAENYKKEEQKIQSAATEQSATIASGQGQLDSEREIGQNVSRIENKLIFAVAIGVVGACSGFAAFGATIVPFAIGGVCAAAGYVSYNKVEKIYNLYQSSRHEQSSNEPGTIVNERGGIQFSLAQTIIEKFGHFFFHKQEVQHDSVESIKASVTPKNKEESTGLHVTRKPLKASDVVRASSKLGEAQVSTFEPALTVETRDRVHKKEHSVPDKTANFRSK